MKKNRILIIAIALSIFFHILIFIFAPELQSEINSNDYPKRITKISIFRDDSSGAPENRNLEMSKSRNIDENSGAPSRNLEISKSRNIDENSGAPKRAGELAIIPKALNPKTPPYPEILEEEGIEGTVTLELLISKDGKVLKARVIKSDHELFSESALKAAKKYKFSPGKLADGTSADSLIEFVVKFEISL